MWKKNEDFSSFLSSKEAMSLAAMLRGMDQDLLSRAASAASSGNTDLARELLSPVMQDPKVRELLSKMEGNNGGI